MYNSQRAPAVPAVCCWQVLCTGCLGIAWVFASCSDLLSYKTESLSRVGLPRLLPAPGLPTWASMLQSSGCPSAPACQCLVPRVLVALAAALVPEDKELATRLHSQTMLNKLAPIIPGFWGGSAGERGETLPCRRQAVLSLGVLARVQHSCGCVAGCKATLNPLSVLCPRMALPAKRQAHRCGSKQATQGAWRCPLHCRTCTRRLPGTEPAPAGP